FIATLVIEDASQHNFYLTTVNQPCPSTGVTNLVGGGGYADIRGLAFISSVPKDAPEDVPEPVSVLSLLIVGAVAAGDALKKKTT
ncbi:MAG: hypothetical protein AAGF66_12465, partial [Cyanobacteria bacterium P01_H01_bin.119]